MSDVPEEVISDVLRLLPVKSLLRFRSVCKKWCSIIDSRAFVKRHLNRSLEARSNLSLILKHRSAYSNEGKIFQHCSLYSIDFDSLDTAVELDLPRNDPKGVFVVVGSCNGLLALNFHDEGLLLWNPSTKRYKKVPLNPVEFPDGFGVCMPITYGFGFGYDRINEDYKVIRIIHYIRQDNLSVYSEVKLYSLKTNSWKRIKDFPYYLHYKGANGVLVNNALHWVVSREPVSDYDHTPSLVVTFDFENEEYREVTLPDFGSKCVHLTVEVFGGCLSLNCHYVPKRVELWVMNEYGMKESWIKLYSITHGRVIRSFVYLRAICYTKSGDKIIMDQDGQELLCYDPLRKQVKRMDIHNIPSDFDTHLYVESLVPLNGIGREKKKKKLQARGDKKKKGGFLSQGFKLKL